MACIYENVEDWCCKLVSLSCAGYIDGMLIIPEPLSSVMGSCLSLFFHFIFIVVAVGFLPQEFEPAEQNEMHTHKNAAILFFMTRDENLPFYHF